MSDESSKSRHFVDFSIIREGFAASCVSYWYRDFAPLTQSDVKSESLAVYVRAFSRRKHHVAFALVRTRW
jgi:hypothetical protein